MTTISSRPRNAFPGDKVRIMRASHTDINGFRWEAGTEYMPFYSGVNNTMGALTVQTVIIGGMQVRFVSGGHAK